MIASMSRFSSEISDGLSRRARLAGGQPISALMAQALARPELISLAAGFVDQASLPVDATRAALESLLSDPDAGRAALQYGTTIGDGALRELLLSRQLAADQVTASEVKASVDQL